MALASGVLRHYIKAYIGHIQRKEEESTTDSESVSPHMMEDEIEYYDITTSDEPVEVPRGNWTMLIPKYPELPTWSPQAMVSHTVMEQIVENNLLGNSVEEEFPHFRQGFLPSLSGRCGQPGPQEQIVGGEEATPHSYPWMAALFVDGKVIVSLELILSFS